MSQHVHMSGAGGAPDTDLAIPDEGGMMVAIGPNGCGKSETLKSLTALSEGEGAIALKHGRKTGEVSGFGVTIGLGARTTRKGSLEVVGLTGRMDIAAIVDPGYKARDACNRAIIKALVRMLGLVPKVQLFHELAGSRLADEGDEGYAERMRVAFDDLMPAGLSETDDLVEMARKVKDAFDAAARRTKGAAERRQGEADALLAAGDDLDLKAEHDAEVLQGILEEVLARQGAVKDRIKRHGDLVAAADAAKQAVDSGGPGEDDFTEVNEAIARSEAELEASGEKVTAAQLRVDQLREELRDAEVARDTALGDEQRVRGKHEANEQRLADLEDSRDGWEIAQKAVAALEEAEAPPTPDDVEALAGEVTEARRGVEVGALIRNAIEKREKGRTARREAADMRGREEELREAGKGTDAILSRLINEAGIEGMSVIDGEVMAIAPGEREPRAFLDMSDGQRTRIACDATIPVAIQEVPEGELAIIVLGQRVYQDLAPKNRRALAEHVRGRRVLLFTALPTDDPVMRIVLVTDDSDLGITDEVQDA